MIRPILIFILVMTASVHAQTGSEWKDIPLENPSFEDGSGVPDGWRIYKGNQTRRSHASVIAWDKEIARTGKRSYYIEKEDGGPIRLVSKTSIPVTPGVVYRVEAWVRTTGAGKYAVALIGASSSERDPDGKQWGVNKTFLAETASLDWQKVSLEFTPPDWVKNFTVSAVHGNGARDGTPIEFWFDDFSLQEKERSTTSPASP